MIPRDITATIVDHLPQFLCTPNPSFKMSNFYE